MAADGAYEKTSGRAAADIVGKVVFDAFPESPFTDDDPESPANLRRSRRTVLATGEADGLPLIRYVVEDDPGRYVERYWNIVNVPLLGNDGRVDLILIHPEEVTSFIDEQRRLHAGDTGSSDAATGTEADADEPQSRARAVEAMFSSVLSRLQGLNDLVLAFVGADNIDDVGRVKRAPSRSPSSATSTRTLTWTSCRRSANAPMSIQFVWISEGPRWWIQQRSLACSRSERRPKGSTSNSRRGSHPSSFESSRSSGSSTT